MSGLVKVKFYNTFWNKKIVSDTGGNNANDSYWPGLPWNPVGYPTYPNSMDLADQANYEKNWMIEESRITGGYNNQILEIGVKAYLNEVNTTQRHRFNSLIHSGIFNATTGVNRTNVFSVGESISKSLEPSFGVIQRTKSYSSNLIIFQENKVSQSLIDKDITYTSEGGTSTQPIGVVLGQVIPYKGDFGIGCSPESFADFGFRRYFADPYKGSVLRLSQDGLTEISKTGMQDFFRDELNKITCTPKTYQVSNTSTTNPGGLVTVPGGLTTSITTNTIDGTNTEGPTLFEYTSSNPLASGAMIDLTIVNGVVTVATVTSAGSGYAVGDTFTYSDFSIGGSTNVVITLQASDFNSPPAGDFELILGSDSQFIEIGMVVLVAAASGGGFLQTGAYVIDVKYTSPYKVTLNKPIPNLSGTTNLRFLKSVKDKIVGGYDIYDRVYVISLQQPALSPTEQATYKTLTFDETVSGWNSFYTYAPSNAFSLQNKYYSTSGNGLWKHHDNAVINNRGTFYGVYNNSYVDFIFNDSPSSKKVFQTISYEGDNGWQVDYFKSDIQQTDPNLPILVNAQGISYSDSNSYLDTTVQIKSYDQGLYIDPMNGQSFRAGFNRKENLYVANLINNSTARPGEIIFGNNISGIKGYFSKVKISTDNYTDVGGLKEVWSVGSKIVRSS
tara:strand:+ start:4320 stop:6332 length:2013 start_codon:yes stop_codon:yes gene_type:complete